jgi:hypothetical protein
MLVTALDIANEYGHLRLGAPRIEILDIGDRGRFDRRLEYEAGVVSIDMPGVY